MTSLRLRSLTGTFAIGLGSLVACSDGGESSTSGGSGVGGAAQGGQAQGGSGGMSDGGSGGTGAGLATGGGGPGGNGVGGEGGAGPKACVPKPTEPIVALEGYSNSEDLAFDGQGNVVLRSGSSFVRVTSTGVETNLFNHAAQTLGTRFAPNGDLMIAAPNTGLEVWNGVDAPTLFLGGLGGPNGVYVDFDGNVFVTEFGAGKVTRISAEGQETQLAEIAGAPNGIVKDDERAQIFFTDYFGGTLHRMELDGANRTLVASLPDASPDGIVLDECGNLYAVDQGGSRLFFVPLDEVGNGAGDPVLIASFPTNVANVQFGSGDGWNPTSLYVIGTPGTLYEVPVGVGGRPVPTP